MAMEPSDAVVDLQAALGVLRDESLCAQLVGRLFAKLDGHVETICEVMEISPAFGETPSLTAIEAIITALVEMAERVAEAR